MRLIDANKLLEDYTQTFVVEHGIASAEMFQGVVNQSPTVEAIPVTEKAFEMFEADYENRLWSDSLDACNEIIQEKINALKGEDDESKLDES